MELQLKALTTDFLIIGGGTAGCYAALTFTEVSGGNVLIAEKANIKRSGCLAAGVNAINAYIVPGKTPEDYVDYARRDAEDIVREDLLRTMAEGLNRTAAKMERLGLTILKDEQGQYVTRGNRNIKINGENIKPILAGAVASCPQITVLNRVNVFDYIIKQGRIQGAYAIAVDEPVLYVISAKAVLCATGGASGLYRPNHPGFSRHKMWYPPFNTGAGYAMGIRGGAEMTTLEMRFIALRCKDTIAPTGTLAQGVGARQINALGEVYEQKYGITTSQRVYGTVTENLEGRGPCYLRTAGITKTQEEDLQKAYLNMAPGQTLRWIESRQTPGIKNVEIEGTEPYIVGGHTASGYWVDVNRETTIRGLYAAGDVAGGCPQKYVTGAFAEGEIAAKAAARYMGCERELSYSVIYDSSTDRFEGCNGNKHESEAFSHSIINGNTLDKSEGCGGSKCEGKVISQSTIYGNTTDRFEVSNGSGSEITPPDMEEACNKKRWLEGFLNTLEAPCTTDELEEAMQAVMDEYAGGIGSNYRFSEKSLVIAEDRIRKLEQQSGLLGASGMQELVYILELQERLTLCRSVMAHLAARKETRWHSFAEYTDYPDSSDKWKLYVNSKLEDGKLNMIFRPLVQEGEKYEH
ncbi:adenylyl-sulfate reductase subunit alpha [Anaerocolumna jejuensis]|uniref:adenylyl-sulfate reductase subunit alpha n=1 Tax=Anaerocolumna jejuensis TaxID=259063 RepID=UPI003F7BFE23